MSESVCEIFRSHSQPLEPIPTSEVPILRPLTDIRAVIFDVYGTLLISASGDISAAGLSHRGEAFVAALDSSGGPRLAPDEARRVGDLGVACLMATIEAHQDRIRSCGIANPEVEIREVWRETLAALVRDGVITPEAGSTDLTQLAANFESRVNPCWPMPHALDCLGALRRAGMTLGIISNAQFYTPQLLPALLGEPLTSLGFDSQLQYYSYIHGEAKPGLSMFHLATETLERRGISAHHTLYIGNDMLNDILPASKVGFHTALFAGDARSLRRRDDEPDLAELVPDLVMSDLIDCAGCVLTL